MVKVRSSTPSIEASRPISFSRSFRNRGSPPVIRTFSAPRSTNIRVRVASLRSSAAARGQELVVLAEQFLGHAVGAAKVAAVGDRDARSRTGRWNRSTSDSSLPTILERRSKRAQPGRRPEKFPISDALRASTGQLVNVFDIVIKNVYGER